VLNRETVTIPKKALIGIVEGLKDVEKKLTELSK